MSRYDAYGEGWARALAMALEMTLPRHRSRPVVQQSVEERERALAAAEAKRARKNAKRAAGRLSGGKD